MDESLNVMVVETVLLAKIMEKRGELREDVDDDLEYFADRCLEIAQKAQKAFGDTEDEFGGWDEAYAVMQEELKRLYAPKKTYYVTFKVEGRYTVQVDAASIEEAKEMAQAEFDAANLNEMDMIDSEPVTVEDENDIVWEA